MSDCCSAVNCDNDEGPSKLHCPVNGKLYIKVPMSTLFHHLHQPWKWQLKAQAYYFCDDPECEVVYFGQDGVVIEQSELRTPVGIKEQRDDSIICYCFGVTRRDAMVDSAARQFVLAKTRAGICACDTRNPSGRCCLKDFPKPGPYTEQPDYDTKRTG